MGTSFIGVRLSKGQFYTSFENLRENTDKRFNYFRMSVKLFDELAMNISENIRAHDTHMRLSIPSLEMDS